MFMSQSPECLSITLLGKSLCRCNYVGSLEVRSSWIIRWALRHNCPYRREAEGDRTDMEKVIWSQRKGWEWCGLKPGMGPPLGAGGGMGWISPSVSGRSVALLTPWFRAFGLQNLERRNSCWCEPLRCGDLWGQPQEIIQFSKVDRSSKRITKNIKGLKNLTRRPTEYTHSS